MFRSAFRPSFRAVLLGGLAAGALVVAAPACAASAQRIRIDAGPLDSALMSLAAQTHQQLLFSPSLVSGRKAPALDGAYTAEEALGRLLAGTDIAVTRAGPNVLVLKAGAEAKAANSAQRTGPAAEGDPQGRHPFGNEPSQAAALAPELGAAAVQPTTVSAIEVTGTHIRGVRTPSPLLVVTHAELERTGHATLVGALRTLPQFFGGGEAEATQATGANPQGSNSIYATGLNLHGLGANATLVLINGRRVAGTGASGDFVDVSSIPTAAVERVEVLLDGASALYGSDAVGGVVNIIMRRNYQGAELRLQAGSATAGDPQERQASATLGRRWTGGDLLLAYEAQYRTALAGSKRPFTATADLRPLGGTDHRVFTSFPGNIMALTSAGFSPAYAIPAGQSGVNLTPGSLEPGVVNLTNQRLGLDVLPRQRLQSLYASVHQKLGPRLTLSADARFSRRDYETHLPSPTATFTVTRANPFYVSPTGAASESIAYSFEGDLPPPVEHGSAESLAATFGGSLALPRDWRAQSYVAFAQETDRKRDAGLLNTGFLNEALGLTPDNPATGFSTASDGFFNPFSGTAGSNSPTITRFIGSGEIESYGRSQVLSAELKADGSLWRLPGGELKAAAGLQGRREGLVERGFNLVSGPTPFPSATTDDTRDIGAAFAELDAPIFGPANSRPGLYRLELSLAGRIEHYEATGSTTNPKVGVLWEPTPDLKLRATYGTSFRAPELRELFDPAIYAPSLLPLGQGRLLSLILVGGNPGLRPETATSWTAGFEYRPDRWPGLDVQATWFDTRFHNRIGRPVAANLVGALSDATLANFITRISPGSNPADLALIQSYLDSPSLSTLGGVFPAAQYGAIVDMRYVNTAALHVSGIDFTGRYSLAVGDDTVVLGLNGEYLLRYDEQITPDAPVLDHLNLPNFPLRFRGRATADWTHGRFTAGVALNYANAYRDLRGAKIADNTTVDLQLRLDPPKRGPARGVAVLFNVRNVFDTAPPFYDNPFGIGYDASNGDPIGRFVSVQLVRSW